MSRKPKNHVPRLHERLAAYCEARGLTTHMYSPYHMRVFDDGFTVLDVWTTGRYYIQTTDYKQQYDDGVIPERFGEKGNLPVTLGLWPFLDGIFFGGDMSEYTDFREEDVVL